ncbi:putative ATP-dependent endonuclease of OLD family [Thermosipho japonicus]|uniref:Putative ATP-dependent endonuclease of OLD family n=1 Tax=Thermosipho japonicus TaxID=90323 RepID=A0A841GS60_9BACT|nr:AAA family ATPase [Thermosipho japonicus]MBB6062803.1 putative ATP-dependent endonuclease of OLD family [Thermosipho japonicus]
MKIRRIHIHNFRSIKDVSIELKNYSLLIGENNVGKTNIISALRIFYDDFKYDPNRDFPKFDTDDQESWIEIEYLTTKEEQSMLKEEYQSDDRILKVRKILKTKDNKFSSKIKTNQSNIFAYENGMLSSNFFYGARNISQAKLGTVIYIPAISKIDESLKTSGPSPFRKVLNFVINKIIQKSRSYDTLGEAFEKFNKNFKNETVDGISISKLIEEINKEIDGWGVKFGINVKPIEIDEIVKTLISHYMEDENLGEELSINLFGQGLQRHLIYTIIKLSSKYTSKTFEKTNKKDFSPDFTLLLFEEPEVFLHPSQQERLNVELDKLSELEDTQVIITTHSPIFVSKNINKLSTLIRVKKDKETKVYQINESKIETLLGENTSMFKFFSKILHDDKTPESLKRKIESRKLAQKDDDMEYKLKEESFKYFLWIDSERAKLFFAKHVIICEGATEKVFFDFLLNTKWIDLKQKHIYFLDSMGKYNIHRYMNLFKLLGIEHSIIMDKDRDSEIHELINSFIEKSKNEFTNEIYYFDPDIEGYLSIEKPNENRQKPLNIMVKYSEKMINGDKINKLRDIIEKLLNKQDDYGR